MKISKFNNPWTMSFKDWLAITMCAPFIGAIFRFMGWHIAGDLELIKTLVPVVITVLGGYFGQEVATSYFTRAQSAYGGYGYSASPVTASISQESSEAGIL